MGTRLEFFQLGPVELAMLLSSITLIAVLALGLLI
jgi:hypothetical protein